MSKIRIIFVLFFISLFTEGIIRKWIMPSFPSMAAFTVKYLLLLILAFYLNRKKVVRLLPANISIIFQLYTLIVVFWAFVVGMFYNGPLVAIVATIQYCAPIVIVYAIVYIVQDRVSLNRLLKLMAIIAIPVFIIAFIQYFSPANAAINRYGVEDYKYIAMVGNSVRVTSVFSYISPFGDCCIFLCAFSLCLITSFQYYNKRVQYFIIMLFIFAVVGGFMSGARMVVGLIGFNTLIIALYFVRKGNFKFIALIGFIFLVFIFLYFEYNLTFVDNFLQRINAASDDTGGRVGKMLDFKKMYGYAGLLGFGSGFTSNALQPLLSFKSPVYFEEELGRIVLDFGAIGAIAMIAIRILILKNVYTCYSIIKDRQLKSISLACVLVIIPMSVFLQLCLFNWFAYMCYYIFIGINLAIANIEFSENETD